MDIESLPNWWSIVFRHKGKKIEFTSHEEDLDGIRKVLKILRMQRKLRFKETLII